MLTYIILGALSLMTTTPHSEAKPLPVSTDFYALEAKRIAADGKTLEPVKLSTYKGKALLIVNTASECGYTAQYKGLQAIYDEYRSRGFEVLGFPSNDFGGQEPGSNAEIKDFCERKFKVSFPLFEKNPVSGKQIQPLYSHLTKNAPTTGEVSWNFEKFLVSKDGRVVGRFKSKVTPESKELTQAIEKALAE
jgi:glutathione peroxidase